MSKAPHTIPQLEECAPEPHPLDFDWRFTGSTASSIADLLKPHHTIACIGCPTIFDRLIRTRHNAHLIDQNPFYGHHYQQYDIPVTPQNIEHADILAMFPHGVILDPPWYVGDYLSWLHRIVPQLSVGASLYIVVYPSTIRPSAPLERAYLTHLMSRIGLLRILDIDVRYEMPEFERRTLKSRCVPHDHDWRTAELWHLVIEQKTSQRQPPTTQRRWTDWQRFRRKKRTVALWNEKKIDCSDIMPPYIDNTYILRSVSAAEPARDRINVWTSTNHAALVKLPWLSSALTNWAMGHTFSRVVSGAAAAGAAEFEVERLFETLQLSFDGD